MIRSLIILAVSVAALLGSLIAAWATTEERDRELRGYIDATLNADLPFRVPRLGVNAELTQYGEDELAEQLRLMQNANITWVRQFFSWRDIEAETGTFEWAEADRIVDAMSAYPGLELVAVLSDSPDWARTETDSETPTPPANPDDFADFAQAFAERYGTTIDYYQIWDEPNLRTSWGLEPPQAAEYAALLRTAYNAIHTADEDATVIAAALAPTTEQGPQNISDLLYLEALYDLGIQDYSDAIAAKPYGFNSAPDDRTVSGDTLNFSRIVALREIMERYGDGTTPLWASNWGWNSLPEDWAGSDSIWGSVSEAEQTRFTVDALNRAEREWPWIGGMILFHWQPDAPSDDPVWGFSLLDPQGNNKPLLNALSALAPVETATNGLFPPTTPFAHYSGVWTFSELGADIGWVQDSQLQFNFMGSNIALLLRKGNYVAYLYPTIDNQPANAVPQDAAGNAYIILTSGTERTEVTLVPVANHLAFGEHQLNIVTDRGSDQWALVGYAVSSGNLAAPYQQQINLALFTAVIAGISTLISAWAVPWRRLFKPVSNVLNGLNDAGELLIGAITSIALMIGMLLTWGDAVPNLLRREPVQLVLSMLTAGLIYLQPGLILTIVAAAVLFVLFYHRLALGLILVVFWSPFFLFPVELYQFAFPMSELLMLITSGAWILRLLSDWGRTRQVQVSQYGVLNLRLHPLDYAIIAWVVLGFISLVWTQYRNPAVTELRTMILEPALFYTVLRTLRPDRKVAVRLVDALLLAGFLVAIIGLWLFLRGESVITAEEGARRLASVYGSPNNVALFLGRCIPFALAFCLIAVDRQRRIMAGVVFSTMTLAAVLTLSAGGLLLGLPTGITVVMLLVWGKRALIPLAGLAAAAAAAFTLALQSARFARIFQFDEGTNFYRIRVWQSAINIIRDHPITGLGLDQFLYAFRGKYIFPDAWQEPDLSHPHNFALDFWVRLGVLGILLFIIIQAVFWRTIFPLYRHFRGENPILFAIMVGAMGSMANLLAHGLVDNSVFVQDLSYVFVLLLGLIPLAENMRAIDRETETMV